MTESPLVCFPSRIDWEQVKIKENSSGRPNYGYRVSGQEYAEQYAELLAGRELPPPPKVISTDPIPRELPAPVALLADRSAYSEDWRIKIQYSRGYATRYRGQWQEEELFAVRFERLGHGAFAVYRSIAGRESWAWRAVWLWGESRLPFGAAGVTELKQWLDVGGQKPDAWYEEIATRVAEQERLAPLRTRYRADVRKAVDGFESRASLLSLSWPGRFLLGLIQGQEALVRGAGLYTAEEVGKILTTIRKASAKSEEAS